MNKHPYNGRLKLRGTHPKFNYSAEEMLETWTKSIGDQYMTQESPQIYIPRERWQRIMFGIEYLAKAAGKALQVTANPVGYKDGFTEYKYRASFEHNKISFYEDSDTNIWQGSGEHAEKDSAG